MARPPLVVGTYGEVNVIELGPRKFAAETRFRMEDGTLKRVQRTGKSQAMAKRRLKEQLARLVDEVEDGALARETRVVKIADAWLDEVRHEVETGALSAGTDRIYESYVKNWIKPTVGELQARELTVSTVDRLIKRAHREKSYNSAKSVRTVLNGICGYAVRHGAMRLNPVRSVGRLARGAGKQIVALDRAQRQDLLDRLEAFAASHQCDQRGRKLGARSRVWLDLPDIVRAMLATGIRLGELLALVGKDVDTAQGTLTVDHHIVRIAGQGLVRVSSRKGQGAGLLLKVPGWSLELFTRRAAAAGEQGALFPAWNGRWLDPSNTGALPQIRGHGWLITPRVPA